jgi:hypothetical protein
MKQKFILIIGGAVLVAIAASQLWRHADATSPRLRAAEVRVRSAYARVVRTQPIEPTRPLDDDQRLRQALAGDPVASLVPGLGGASPEQQLEVLRWMMHLEPEALVAAIPELAEAPLDFADKQSIADETIHALAELLEARGVVARPLADDFRVAQSIDDPAADDVPPEFLPTLRPHVDDSRSAH